MYISLLIIIVVALQTGERKLNEEADAKRAKRKAAAKVTASPPVELSFDCVVCDCVCPSKIGLISHQRKCSQQSVLSYRPCPTTAY